MSTIDLPTTIEKPWGHELVWAKTDRYAGKILHVKAGHRLSLQKHEHKDETLCVLAGEIDVEINGEFVQLRALESLRIRPGDVHRIIARTDSDVLEVSTPELDDVVRLSDDYGRASE